MKLKKKEGHNFLNIGKNVLIVLILLSFTVDGLKVTSSLKLDFYIPGAPFVVELLMIIFIVLTFFHFFEGIILPVPVKRYAFSLILYFSFFLFPFILNFNLSQIIGKGTLRIFFEVILFVLCCFLYDFTKKEIRLYMVIFVVTALVNAIYNIGLYLSIFIPVFKYGYRSGYGEILMRYSGFSIYPSFAGTLLAGACAFLVPFCLEENLFRKRLLSLLVAASLLLGLIISGSRSAAVGLVVACAIFFIISPRKIKLLNSVILLALAFGPLIMHYSPAGEFFRTMGLNRDSSAHERSEERRVGKECRSRWSPYH